MNIILVEDSALIRTELVRFLSAEPRLRVMATASEEEQAVQLILAQQPDTVLLDLGLAPGSGLNVLRRIRTGGSGARVLILSNQLRPEIRAACLAAGASACYQKDSEVQACLAHLVSWLPPQPAAPLEQRRLQQLSQLNLQNQEIFDNLTNLAANIADMPVALISLVEEHHQRFLARTGIDLTETSRTIAFCAHTIVQGSMLEVPDARLDPRFHDNPLVTGPAGVRFYAGIPLVLSTGDALGTLCVIDHHPGQLSERQRLALKTLASSAVSEIELRRRILELEQEAERRYKAEQHVLHLATRDPLTALPNRATLRDRLEQQTLQAKRQQQQFAVLFLDLDRFKPINDAMGHEAGDDALLGVAARLVGALRESDTVARLGGDEFAILLPNLSGETEALRIATQLITTMEEPLPIKGHSLYLSASIGVALYPAHGTSGDQLLGHADLAMYEAKRQGGSQVCAYTLALSARDQEIQTLSVELQDALRTDQLLLHYQPQLVVETGQLCGVEALLRWNHPQRGLLLPGHFIELVETRGLTRELTRKVLDLALQQLQQWDLDGLHVPRIAVNISAPDIRYPLVETVRSALQRHSVAPQRLELEITESMLTSDGVETLQVLEQLRQLGVSIAVDDFGVGYSSLSQIHRLPIDGLKIDRSFVQELQTSTVDKAIITAVLTMAAALNLRTVAEGVESAAQYRLLEQMGCACAQGYLLSAPLPAGELQAWCRHHTDTQADTASGALTT